MAQVADNDISRRGAIALAAALAATAVTAVATVGGLRHWQSQTAHQPAAPAAVQPAPTLSLVSPVGQLQPETD